MDILIGETIHIGLIGDSFVITTKNNINGRIIFTNIAGQLKSYSLTKYHRCEFNVSEMIENKYISFYPDFVEFESDDDLESIIIDLY